MRTEKKKGIMNTIKRRMKNILHDKKGFAGYIEAAIASFVICMLIAIALETIPAFMLKHQLDNYAEKAVRRIEVYGRADAQVMGVLRDIAEEYNLSPDITVDADYIGGSKIQINEKIVLTAAQDYEMNFGLLGNYRLSLYGRSVGYSEVFYK